MRTILTLFIFSFISAAFSQQENAAVFEFVIYVHDGDNVSISNAKVTVTGADGVSFTGVTDKAGRLEFVQTADKIYLKPGQTYTIVVAGVPTEYYESSSNFTTDEGYTHSRIVQGISVTKVNSTRIGG